MSPSDAARPETAFVAELRNAQILPVLRTRTAKAAVEATSHCFDAGLNVVELTATTPGWPEALSRARREHPGGTIGVGTVLTVEQAHQAVELGADFLVSPCPVPAVREDLGGRVPFLEGGLTVAELLAATRLGIAKLFPAHVGGVQYLRSVLAISPSSMIVPTGGIPLRDVPTWLAAGALAVGVGGDLLAAKDMTAAIVDALSGVPSQRL